MHQEWGWPVEDSGPYRLRVTVDLIDGRPEVVGLELWGADPAKYAMRTPWRAPSSETAITSVDVRNLRVGELRSRALAEYAHHSDLIGNAPAASDALRKSVKASQAAIDAAPVRVGRRPIYGRAHFAQVAGVYTDAMRRGKAPTSAVASWGTVDKSTAAKWVARARALGLLPATTKGRAAIATETTREEP